MTTPVNPTTTSSGQKLFVPPNPRKIKRRGDVLLYEGKTKVAAYYVDPPNVQYLDQAVTDMQAELSQYDPNADLTPFFVNKFQQMFPDAVNKQEHAKQGFNSFFSVPKDKSGLYWAPTAVKAEEQYDLKQQQKNPLSSTSSTLIKALTAPCPNCSQQIKDHFARLQKQEKDGKDGKKKNLGKPNHANQRHRYSLLAPCQVCTASLLKKFSMLFQEPLTYFPNIDKTVLSPIMTFLFAHLHSGISNPLSDQAITNLAQTGQDMFFMFYFQKHELVYRFCIDFRNMTSSCKAEDITRRVIFRWVYDITSKAFVGMPGNLDVLMSAFGSHLTMQGKIEKYSIEAAQGKKALAHIQDWLAEFEKIMFAGWPAPSFAQPVIPVVTTPTNILTPVDITSLFKQSAQP